MDNQKYIVIKRTETAEEHVLKNAHVEEISSECAVIRFQDVFAPAILWNVSHLVQSLLEATMIMGVELDKEKAENLMKYVEYFSECALEAEKDTDTAKVPD